MSGEPTVDAREELAELVADLRAVMEQASLQGARLLPSEPFLDRDALPMAGWTPPAPGGEEPARTAPAPRRGAPPGRERPPREAAARPADAPRGAAGGGAFRPPAQPPTPRPEKAPPLFPTKAPAPPVSSPTEGAQPQLGAWGRFARPAGEASPPTARVASEVPEGADLPAIRGVLGDCRRCGLCADRENIVFGVGDPAARLMIVGEAPGFQEDRDGEPFVGPAGQMLDRMVENVLGLQRAQVYIANVVKCRPPNNRNPAPEEIAQCEPFLRAQMEAVAPDVILVLGRIAAQALFQTSQGISRMRGEWRVLEVGGRKVPVMCTFHPAYLLRKPEDKRLTFLDLKSLRGRLDDLST